MSAHLEAVRAAAHWFEAAADGFAPLVDEIAGAELVPIGEASHGTREFYEARAELTKSLIARHGFNIVALEADWPDADRAHRWVRHNSSDADAAAALGGFTRFPRWMWRNTEVVSFLSWLRAHNAPLDEAARVGFYGLDLYSSLAADDYFVAEQNARVVQNAEQYYRAMFGGRSRAATADT
jgi:erythromycin esterase-like protein